MPAPPLAHLGHWYVSLPVFMGPVLVLVIALKLQTWREAQRGPDRSGKRSSVIATQAEGEATTTIVVSGPLDYPALIGIETELGKTASAGGQVVLDLRGVAEIDREAAWSLCDVVGRAGIGGEVCALVEPVPATRDLRAVCAQEGIELRERHVAKPA